MNWISFYFYLDWGQRDFPTLDPENRALVQLPRCPWHVSVCACVDMWRSQEQKKSWVTCWHSIPGYFLMFLVEQIAFICPCPHVQKGRLWRRDAICLPIKAGGTSLGFDGNAAVHTPCVSSQGIGKCKTSANTLRNVLGRGRDGLSTIIFGIILF